MQNEHYCFGSKKLLLPKGRSVAREKLTGTEVNLETIDSQGEASPLSPSLPCTLPLAPPNGKTYCRADNRKGSLQISSLTITEKNGAGIETIAFYIVQQRSIFHKYIMGKVWKNNDNLKYFKVQM